MPGASTDPWPPFQQDTWLKEKQPSPFQGLQQPLHPCFFHPSVTITSWASLWLLGDFLHLTVALGWGCFAAGAAGHGGLPGAACRHMLHPKISSWLEHSHFFHPLFCTSHSGIDDIAGWREDTASPPSATQMTPPCYQLNFAGIFFPPPLFFSHQLPEVFFPAKTLISSRLNCNKPIPSKCWDANCIERQLFKCCCWPDGTPRGQRQGPPFAPVSPWERGARQARLVTTFRETWGPHKATGAFFSSALPRFTLIL